MPRRPSTARRGVAAAIDVDIYSYGDGTWSYFDEPVLTAAARRAWPKFRRQAWGVTRVGKLPRAAVEYDGLTEHALDTLDAEWRCDRFDARACRRALRVDRASVAAFRERDPRGAGKVADYLTRWLAWLDELEAALERRVGMGDRWEEYCCKHCPVPLGETYGRED
jgi:hypothetical protein